MRSKEALVTTIGNQIISKSKDYYYEEYEFLVCLVAPILNYNVKDENVLKHLGWNSCLDVRIVLEQLELCVIRVFNEQPPENLKEICNVIYIMLFKMMKIMKDDLENEPWIWYKDAFYSADKFIFRLPTEFENNKSLIVKLPSIHKRFYTLFKTMGVRF
ncbi:7215_t:CDS:2 [Funneliformis geosporum]|nr:7215_t:CDS:2 [Funneliformis geosporum]